MVIAVGAIKPAAAGITRTLYKAEPTILEIPTSALPRMITAITATQNSGNELAIASITAALTDSGSFRFF